MLIECWFSAIGLQCNECAPAMKKAFPNKEDPFSDLKKLYALKRRRRAERKLHARNRRRMAERNGKKTH